MSTAQPASPKRAHLLATARRLFYRDGYRVVGIDTLLAEAGVAKMTLYNHFASKEELILAVIEEQDAEVRAALTAAVAAAGRSPTRQFQAVFDWLKGWFESDDFKGCAFLRALSEYPEPDHPIHRAAWRHKQAVNTLLVGLVTDAGARHPTELADALGLLINGAILSAHATGSSAPAATARTAAATLLKHATA
ncbi:MAG: TetR/AcrR family transcriptional regulator [Opitutae bacterium]|nr:TetR/AcrR family transcriptional regulator [Opitutae bacterium]